MAREPITPEQGRRYWLKTSRLMWTVLAAWAFLSILLPMLASSLNAIPFLGLRFGYYMAAQGSLVGFVVIIFWYARRQNSIDEEFHVDED